MSTGDCFVVLAPNCADGNVIFGRNSLQDDESVGVAQEVLYYEAEESADGKCEGEAVPIILQRRVGVWGGDFGANQRNVSIAIAWASPVSSDGESYTATDLVRCGLATSTSAENAVESIGVLISAHAADDAKCSLVICDATAAWLLSSGGKLWAAQKLAEGFHRLPSDGLAVTTAIDKSSDGLADALKTLGLHDGESELNFAACFGAPGAVVDVWCGVEPSGDGSYALTSMFETLRSAADAAVGSGSASVSMLQAEGIACHWFTGTPTASESVFKPFVFSPKPRISPLTKVSEGDEESRELTLLHKLHAQRKPAATEDLKALEASCVDEVNSYLAEHPVADEELDELLKDCVEAEVKFYR